MPDQRSKNGKFLPGNSGNPGGRPKIPEWFKEQVPFVQKRLHHWAQSGSARASLQACQLILAYGLGKPTEHHEVSGHLTLEQLLSETWDGVAAAGNSGNGGNGHG